MFYITDQNLLKEDKTVEPDAPPLGTGRIIRSHQKFLCPPPSRRSLNLFTFQNSALSGWKEGEECAEREIQIALKQGWT